MWCSNLSYSQYNIAKVIARAVKIKRLDAKDLPVEDDSLKEREDRENKVPWPPRVSTQPPSKFFCKWDPENKGIREVNWALIGVVNANEVKKWLIRVKFINHEEYLNRIRFKNHPDKVPATMAKIACSFKERGKIDSLIGVIINQYKEAPAIIVIMASANIGAIKSKLGAGWNILAGGDCRGLQTTLSIKRIL